MTLYLRLVLSLLLLLPGWTRPASASDAESRARKKVERVFERDFRRFTRVVENALQYYEEDLRALLSQHALRTFAVSQDYPEIESSIQAALADPSISLRSALRELVSPDSKAKMHDFLENEILETGSAVAYLEVLKTRKNFNWCSLVTWSAKLGIGVPSVLVFASAVMLAGSGGIVIPGLIVPILATLFVSGGNIYLSFEAIQAERCSFAKAN